MSHQTINWKDGYVANTLGHLSSLYLQFSNLGLLLWFTFKWSCAW